MLQQDKNLNKKIIKESITIWKEYPFPETGVKHIKFVTGEKLIVDMAFHGHLNMIIIKM